MFFVGLTGLSIHVPIIARISERSSDNEFYQDFASQVFSASLLLGSVFSSIFLLSTLPVSNEFAPVLYLAAMVLIYATSQIMHCFPRGLEKFRPAAVSLVLVGLTRIALLVLFLLMALTDLTSALLVYTLPFLGWWVSYIYHEGVPSMKRPKLRFMLSIYSDSFISYLYPLGVQIPVVLGVVLLTSFQGFGTVGDFDIALIPYFALAAIFNGISFVTISKARKLPTFRLIMRRIIRSVIIPMLFLSAFAIVAAFFVETPVTQLLTDLGLPSSVYWPAILLISFGVPSNTLVSMLVAYFQGQGAIRPVGAIVIICALGSIPLQVIFAYFLSIIGVMLSIVLINTAIVLILLIYGNYRSENSQDYGRNKI
jgi:O-antigen/teichoic acid export membrane protein